MNKRLWELIPLQRIGKLEFGIDRNVVRKILGKKYQPFRKSIFAKSLSDAYDEYHVYYSEADKLEAVEIFGGVEVVYHGITLFPGTIDSAKEIIADLEYNGGCFISKDLSIGLYAPDDNGQIEAILVGRDSYY